MACDDDEEVTTKTENVKVSFGTPEMRVYENVSPQRIAIVLSQAAEQDVRIELDCDDGRYKYEGDIIYNGIEYDFEIDADSGRILEWEEDRR